MHHSFCRSGPPCRNYLYTASPNQRRNFLKTCMMLNLPVITWEAKQRKRCFTTPEISPFKNGSFANSPPTFQEVDLNGESHYYSILNQLFCISGLQRHVRSNPTKMSSPNTRTALKDIVSWVDEDCHCDSETQVLWLRGPAAAEKNYHRSQCSRDESV